MDAGGGELPNIPTRRWVSFWCRSDRRPDADSWGAVGMAGDGCSERFGSISQGRPAQPFPTGSQQISINRKVTAT